jgi:hypothetical protein
MRFVASSVAEGGQAEFLTGTLAAGTYRLAVQAWDTPAQRVRYWLAIF